MWCVLPNFARACRLSPQQFFARHRRKLGHSELVVLGQSVVQAVRLSGQSLSPEHAASQPSNISSKRTALPGRRLTPALGGRAFPSAVLRCRRVSAPCLQSALCRIGLACVVVFRVLGRSPCLVRVGAFRIFVLRGARGSFQRGVCRQRFVLRAQAASFVALPGIQSSAIVLAGDGASCCRLTSRSRRTASPPLNSSVRHQGNHSWTNC